MSEKTFTTQRISVETRQEINRLAGKIIHIKKIPYLPEDYDSKLNVILTYAENKLKSEGDLK